MVQISKAQFSFNKCQFYSILSEWLSKIYRIIFRQIFNIQYLFVVQMTQTKVQLKLPAKLALHHFLCPTRLAPFPYQQLPNSLECLGIEAKLRAMVPDESLIYYGHSFVLNFLLIKLNSWIKYPVFQSTHWIGHLVEYFNQLQKQGTSTFRQSRNDGELMAQILLASSAYEYLSAADLDENLEGSALIGSAAIQTFKQVQSFLQKCYFAVTLGVVSLSGRTNPYIPIVHVEKNHPGQIQFARRINELIHLNPNIEKINSEIIQDAYSLRCSPQVHGVSIECLENLKSSIEGLVSKPQTRNVIVNNRRMKNLALRASGQTLLLDNLILALNEIGHMSFLRSERLLNKYLNKSDIANNQHFSYLMILLKKNSYLVCENKQLAISSSADTILLNNYTHDVYANEGSSYKRLLALLQNTKRIVKLELMAALEVIFGMYGKKGSLFANDSMEKTYLQLDNLRSADSFKYGESIEKWLK